PEVTCIFATHGKNWRKSGRFRDMSRYGEVYARWLKNPEAFWADAASAIEWFKPWSSILAKIDGFDRWFVGAECNTAWNCLDRHIAAGRGEKPALIYDSPLTQTKTNYSYRQLTEAVTLFATALAIKGVTKGDRVLIYMPMVPEAVIAMLAAARL